jgi:phosphoglycolate phosphatase
MRFDTLIFDLDGTLSDPSDGIARSVNYALLSCHYESVPEERIHRMIGPPLTEIFEHFLGPLTDSRLEQLVASYRQRYADIGYRENTLYDNITDVIAGLAARGFRMGICTSKREDYATRIVDMFGLLPYFSFVDGGDVHVRKSMQLEKLVAGGLDANTAIMIGDRAVDIEAARHNRIASVGVAWGFGDAEELAAAEPTFLARTPTELPEIFL